MQKRVLPLILALTAIAAILAASASGARQDVTINLVAYSTPRPVLDKLIAAFKATPQGSGINVKASYGPSSAQGQAVANGLPEGVQSDDADGHFGFTMSTKMSSKVSVRGTRA